MERNLSRRGRKKGSERAGDTVLVFGRREGMDPSDSLRTNVEAGGKERRREFGRGNSKREEGGGKGKGVKKGGALDFRGKGSVEGEGGEGMRGKESIIEEEGIGPRGEGERGGDCHVFESFLDLRVDFNF